MGRFAIDRKLCGGPIMSHRLWISSLGKWSGSVPSRTFSPQRHSSKVRRSNGGSTRTTRNLQPLLGSFLVSAAASSSWKLVWTQRARGRIAPPNFRRLVQVPRTER
jgi:hypothetical protein